MPVKFSAGPGRDGCVPFRVTTIDDVSWTVVGPTPDDANWPARPLSAAEKIESSMTPMAVWFIS
jgi:hypothetical protein